MIRTELTVRGSDPRPVRLAHIPALRAAFVLASLIIFVGLGLGLWVDPRFLLLPALVGAGLLVSGVGGVCPMALFMERLLGNGHS